MTKLWQKTTQVSELVEKFTVGRDNELDLLLAKHDVLGSMAHTQMLSEVGLLPQEDLKAVHQELKKIYQEIVQGKFSIEAGVEDIHSQVEMLLTQRIGDAGKKIHSGRSRNDQVLVDLKLFFRDELHKTVEEVKTLFALLQELSEKHKNVLLPGYTHYQIAMPSSFGLWFGAYAESLVDDMETLLAAYKVSNKNPLGSGAGYGSSFPLNRTRTTELLGFDDLNYNVVYAQMSRGKSERIIAQALANVAATLSKMSYDACLFMNQNFGFISFPDELTTGSSIMPHKKNPDVFELIRAKCNDLQALPNQVAMTTVNLPMGYHRDFQILKEKVFPAFETLNQCSQLLRLMLENIKIKDNILKDNKYQYLFSVEEVNKLVLSGVPFREAYKQVGLAIEQGQFSTDGKVNHTHEGSIGNLCNADIKKAFEAVYRAFEFEKVEQKLAQLLK